jgi:hypothetical protein
MSNKLFFVVCIGFIAICSNGVLSLDIDDKEIEVVVKFAINELNHEAKQESEEKPALALLRVLKASKDGDMYNFKLRLKPADCKRKCVIDICDVKVSSNNQLGWNSDATILSDKVLEFWKCSSVRARPRNV